MTADMLQPATVSLESMSTDDLVRALIADAGRLIEEQVTLAQLESQRQSAQARSAMAGLAVATVIGLGALATLVVSAVIALGNRLEGRFDWSTLIIGGALFVVATPTAIWGWRRRVRVSLPASRGELAKEIDWLKRKTRRGSLPHLSTDDTTPPPTAAT